MLVDKWMAIAVGDGLAVGNVVDMLDSDMVENFLLMVEMC